MSHPLRPAHILTHSLLFAAALATSFGTSRTAQAQEACGDTECPKGYTCETYMSDCPLMDCVAGQECRTCEPAEYSSCVPAACETDTDCGAHMKCAAIEQMECTGATEPAVAACEPNTDCDVYAPDRPAEPADCVTTTIHQCQPQWTLPCETAADCGEGFACVEQESCWCSGSGGSVGGGSTGSSGTVSRGGTASGGAAAVDLPLPAEDPSVDNATDAEDGVAADDTAPSGDIAVAPPPDEQCGCEPTGEFVCEVVETACTQDSDCPTDWTCEDNPEGVCWADTNGNSGCTPADPAKLCQPPYSNLGGGYGRGEGTSGGTTGGGDVAVDDSAEPPKAEGPDADGSQASGDSGDTAETPTDADEHAALPEPDDSDAGSNMAGGGCSLSVGSGHAGQFGLMLAAAMAALGLRRRTAR